MIASFVRPIGRMFLFLLLLSSMPAWAGTIIVDGVGPDSNPNGPFATIQTAVTYAYATGNEARRAPACPLDRPFCTRRQR